LKNNFETCIFVKYIDHLNIDMYLFQRCKSFFYSFCEDSMFFKTEQDNINVYDNKNCSCYIESNRNMN